MRTTIAALVGLAVATALCVRLARALAESVHDDVLTATDELNDVRSCASPSHGYLPAEADVLSGRVV